MALSGIVGKDVDRSIVLHAVRSRPSLLIDCANCANPHAFFHEITQEDLFDVHVMQSDLIYTFRDIMKMLPKTAGKLSLKKVAITTFESLFHYENEEENNELYLHSWELMRSASRELDIVVGVRSRGKQFGYAKAYCDRLHWTSSKRH